jgi:hypothetical protein
MLAIQLARHVAVLGGASTHLVSPPLGPEMIVAMLVAGQDQAAVAQASRELAAAR